MFKHFLIKKSSRRAEYVMKKRGNRKSSSTVRREQVRFYGIKCETTNTLIPIKLAHSLSQTTTCYIIIISALASSVKAKVSTKARRKIKDTGTWRNMKEESTRNLVGEEREGPF